MLPVFVPITRNGSYIADARPHVKQVHIVWIAAALNILVNLSTGLGNNLRTYCSPQHNLLAPQRRSLLHEWDLKYFTDLLQQVLAASSAGT